MNRDIGGTFTTRNVEETIKNTSGISKSLPLIPLVFGCLSKF